MGTRFHFGCELMALGSYRQCKFIFIAFQDERCNLGSGNFDSSCEHMLSLIAELALRLKLSYARRPAEIYQETWLKDAVLCLFPDTRDCSPSLVSFLLDVYVTKHGSLDCKYSKPYLLNLGQLFSGPKADSSWGQAKKWNHENGPFC